MAAPRATEQMKGRPMPSPTAMRAVAISGVLLTGCTFIAREVARDPNSLWLITHNVCVPDQRQFGNPSPCMKVDLAAGYVLLKDPNSPTHFVLIPTARVAGIEDPAILLPTAPNYWDQAWRARRYVEERVGRALGRDEVSLAINSINGRTQNQLHIHIDCQARREGRAPCPRERNCSILGTIPGAASG